MKLNPDDHHFANRTLLGMRLKDWRKKKELKIEAAAHALGVSTSTWGHWETGHTFPSGEMLLDLCRLLDLPLQLLFCPHLDECPFHRCDGEAEQEHRDGCACPPPEAEPQP
ncbi:MAG: helix-turn-helix transcriptional regulator [Luteolibacter sp.]